MSNTMNSSASACGRINHIEMKPELINAWLSKNNVTFSSEHAKSNKISDCPAPWG